jgi:hypothetical protein
MIENIEDKDDYVMVFEAPKIIPPEFRLYYDEESGKVLFYTCEKPEGKFIIVDQVTFACARMDMKVVDGRLTSGSPSAVITKLMPDSEKGIECALEDISIIGYGSFNDTQKWKLNVYELR